MNLPAGEKITVLIVEDEPLLLLHAQDFLEDAGFATLTARNADAAIVLLESHDHIRIVFTDVNMPGSMDGVRLARAIRDRWPPIYLVVVSGAVQSPELPHGSKFFSKPFEAKVIVDTMYAMVA